MKKPLIITVHGWNSGGLYMKYFNPHFAALDYPVYNYEYGWMLAASLRNRSIARRILAFVRFAWEVCGRKSVIVAHSNGAVVSNYAAWMSEQITGLVLVNAALNRDIEFAPSLAFVHNWYSPGDWPLRLARLIPFHAWGDLGARPYDGVSPNVTNFNKGGSRDFMLHSKRHSDLFYREPLRSYYMPMMAERVEHETCQSRNF